MLPNVMAELPKCSFLNDFRHSEFQLSSGDLWWPTRQSSTLISLVSDTIRNCSKSIVDLILDTDQDQSLEQGHLGLLRKTILI